MEKKKKLIISASAVAGTMVLGSAFALFSDKIIDNTTGKVGTVDIEGSANLTHTQINRTWLAEAMDISEKDHKKDERVLSNKFKLFDKIGLHLGFFGLNSYGEILPILNEEGTSFGDFKDLASIMEEGKDNLNPGDNDFSYNESQSPDILDLVPGTDHEININVENKGTKSVRTRLKIYATAEDAEGRDIPVEDILQQLQIGLDVTNSKPGVTSIHPLDMLCMPLERSISKDNPNEAVYELSSLSDYSEELLSVMGMIPDNDPIHGEAIAKVRNNVSDYIRSGLVLSGSGDNAEIEKFTKKTATFKPLTSQRSYSLNNFRQISAGPMSNVELKEEIVDAPTSGTFKIDVGLANLNGYNNPVEGPRLTGPTANTDIFEGGKVHLRVEIEAMQYRNTSKQSWTPVIQQELSLTVE